MKTTSGFPRPRLKLGVRMKKDKIIRKNVAIYLSDDEINSIDKARFVVGQSRSSYMRRASLDRLPVVIPEINRQAWQQLARLAANVNQWQKSINSGITPPVEIDLSALVTAVRSVRAALIGTPQP